MICEIPRGRRLFDPSSVRFELLLLITRRGRKIAVRVQQTPSVSTNNNLNLFGISRNTEAAATTSRACKSRSPRPPAASACRVPAPYTRSIRIKILTSSGGGFFLLFFLFSPHRVIIYGAPT